MKSSVGPTLKRALVHASNHFERLITAEWIRSGVHMPAHSEPRFYIMAYLYEYDQPRFSMPNIAAMLHLTDHTSVLHGLRRAHGHDGKGVALKKEPLWTKEHFKNLVAADRDGIRVTQATADEIERIGLEHLRTLCPKFVFKTGDGWEAGSMKHKQKEGV